jgi:hypothetical protein
VVENDKMHKMLKAQEVELLNAQGAMNDAEFAELVKKLRQLGLEDGDLGYAHYDRLIDKLKAARGK